MESRQSMKMTFVPFFSVVVPTFHRNDLLANCLACLAPGRQDGMFYSHGYTSTNSKSWIYEDSIKPLSNVPNNDVKSQHLDISMRASPSYEVIVADDGRTFTAETMIRDRFPWVRWVQGPGIGPAANRNVGATAARGDWLVFTDDDCLPQPEWLQSFFNSIAAHPGLIVFEGRTIPDRPRRTLAEHSPVGSQAGNLWSCNFTILSSEFHILGGFDPHFRVCMEDNDFALRVREAGLTYPFVENALVLHPWRSRQLAYDGWKSSRAEISDHIRFRQKHPDSPSVSPSRLLILGSRLLWCDLVFIVNNIDIRGIPFAVISFWHFLRLAYSCYRYS